HNTPDISDEDLAEALIRFLADRKYDAPDEGALGTAHRRCENGRVTAVSSLLQTVWWLRQPPR
ncbi:MAG: hypothetical protein ACE5R4_08215, partial [Armatimonadota bacterium]